MARARELRSELGPAAMIAAGTARPAAFWGCFAALLAVQCLPFVIVRVPALLDYPNHLARIFILAHLDRDPILAREYVAAWAPIPDLGFDVIGLAFERAMGIWWAGKAALLAAIVLMATGIAALSAALHDGRPRWFCLLGFFFIFSQVFSLGFAALVIGFGLAVWGLAVWVRLRERQPVALLVWSVPFGLVLFFAHLFAFAAYGVVVTCIEIEAWLARRHRRAALLRAVGLVVPQAILPVIVFLFLSPTALSSSSTLFGSWPQNVRMALLAPIRNYSDAADLLTFAVLAAVIAFGLWSGRLRIAPPMRLALIVMAVLSLFMPAVIADSDGAQLRLPVVAMLVFAAAGDWSGGSRAAVRWMAAGLVALFCLRTALVANAFMIGSRFAADLDRALAGAPRGARIGSVTLTAPQHHRIRPEWAHSVMLQVIAHDAFVPTVFAFKGQQPLRIAAAYRGLSFPLGQIHQTATTRLTAALFANLDYVAIINIGLLRQPLPDNLRKIFQANNMAVFRVLHPHAAAAPG